MKASYYSEYGGSEVLSIKDIEKPNVTPNQICIRVHATTVNRSDCAMLTAIPWIMRLGTGLFKPRKKILGTDFAGVVDSIGPSVTAFSIGDRVFGFNDSGVQSHAEFMVIDESSPVMTFPNQISFVDAVACLEGAHYAINFINKVNLQSGDKVMVNGATGAIGSALVQLLKNKGAQVTATCRKDHFELIKSIGAHRVIDYQKEDFTLDKEKYNYVFDAVGKSTFGKCKGLLVNDGIYISSELGPWIQNLWYSLFSPLWTKLPLVRSKKKVRFPMPYNIIGSIKEIKELMENGHFKAVIDRVYPLEKSADAFAYVLTGMKVGNVVLEI